MWIPSSVPEFVAQVNTAAASGGRVDVGTIVPFGPELKVARYSLNNGLELLSCEDHAAPVIAYHTWFRVGSRHEREGKTGLAHLFEHLMFNETEGRPRGEFDRLLEEAGAENNASTWLDWTHYTISVPSDQLELVVALEAERMGRLVIKEAQVASEKEVVANERRYRVEDDVEGAVNELLWSTAFTTHAYRAPTIGRMADIQSFTVEDCHEFYRTYYAPNNAAIVVVGDFAPAELVKLVSQRYGGLQAAALPAEEVHPEPPQTAERRVEVRKPTPTEKLCVGYHGPVIGDYDHLALTVLAEVLFGGRASRVHRALVRERELASDVRVFVGPFRDPGLFEVAASARNQHTAEELLAVIDEQFEMVCRDPVPDEELERARARLELSLLAGLETVEGKASTIGFFAALLGRPAGAFERLDLLPRITASEVRRAARRFLRPEARSVVLVRVDAPQGRTA
ncbi:M16 family metallopeptidase [Myxococcota bacterium]